MSAGPPGSSTRGRPAPTWRGGGYATLLRAVREMPRGFGQLGRELVGIDLVGRHHGPDQRIGQGFTERHLFASFTHRGLPFCFKFVTWSPSGERRIVDVAVAVAGVEGRLIGRIERGAALEAFGEIRIGEE